MRQRKYIVRNIPGKRLPAIVDRAEWKKVTKDHDGKRWGSLVLTTWIYTGENQETMSTSECGGTRQELKKGTCSIRQRWRTLLCSTTFTIRSTSPASTQQHRENIPTVSSYRWSHRTEHTDPQWSVAHDVLTTEKWSRRLQASNRQKPGSRWT